MTEIATLEAPAAETPAVNPNVHAFDFPGIEGKVSIDCGLIPAEIRLDFLKSKAQAYVTNRVNQVLVRHNKTDLVAAWAAYEAAVKADPLQTAVAKPTVGKPALPDLRAAMANAIADLNAGKVRKMGTGEKKARERVDPLVKAVTSVVVRETYENMHAADPKYTYPMAVKAVGKDGIAHLNALIELRVAAGIDRTALEKMRDTKYINPAKVMLGMTENKAIKDLPSLL